MSEEPIELPKGMTKEEAVLQYLDIIKYLYSRLRKTNDVDDELYLNNTIKNVRMKISIIRGTQHYPVRDIHEILNK
jgi:hypothetical protein